MKDFERFFFNFHFRCPADVGVQTSTQELMAVTTMMMTMLMMMSTSMMTMVTTTTMMMPMVMMMMMMMMMMTTTMMMPVVMTIESKNSYLDIYISDNVHDFALISTDKILKILKYHKAAIDFMSIPSISSVIKVSLTLIN